MNHVRFKYAGVRGREVESYTLSFSSTGLSTRVILGVHILEYFGVQGQSPTLRRKVETTTVVLRQSRDVDQEFTRHEKREPVP